MIEPLTLQDLIFLATILSVTGICTWVFRRTVKNIAFKDMDSEKAKVFLQSQSFVKKLFMTYIRTCNPDGKKDIGLMKWILVSHYIHLVASLILLVMFSADLIYDFGLSIRLIDTSSYINRALIDLCLLLFIGTLPICFLMRFVFELLSSFFQKKRERKKD